MTIELVGFSSGLPVNISSLLTPTGSVGPSDGDWVFAFQMFPPNVTLWAWAAPAGWTLLDQTVDAAGTMQLWCRQWHTGDPTSWTVNNAGSSAGYGIPAAIVVVVRGLIAAPTLVGVGTVSGYFSPATAPGITDSSITPGDVALVFMASKGYGLFGISYSTPPTLPGWQAQYSIGSHYPTMSVVALHPDCRSSPTVLMSTAFTDLSSPSADVLNTFGIQVILPGIPVPCDPLPLRQFQRADALGGAPRLGRTAPRLPGPNAYR
jgi:hypothetical protein